MYAWNGASQVRASPTWGTGLLVYTVPAPTYVWHCVYDPAPCANEGGAIQSELTNIADAYAKAVRSAPRRMGLLAAFGSRTRSSTSHRPRATGRRSRNRSPRYRA